MKNVHNIKVGDLFSVIKNCAHKIHCLQGKRSVYHFFRCGLSLVKCVRSNVCSERCVCANHVSLYFYLLLMNMSVCLYSRIYSLSEVFQDQPIYLWMNRGSPRQYIVCNVQFTCMLRKTNKVFKILFLLFTLKPLRTGDKMSTIMDHSR